MFALIMYTSRRHQRARGPPGSTASGSVQRPFGRSGCAARRVSAAVSVCCVTSGDTQAKESGRGLPYSEPVSTVPPCYP